MKSLLIRIGEELNPIAPTGKPFREHQPYPRNYIVRAPEQITFYHKSITRGTGYPLGRYSELLNEWR